MNRCLPLFATSMLFCALASAAPVACVTNSFQGYIDLGSDGCTLGQTRFFDFQNLELSTGATEISADAVTVIPFGGLFTPGLDFRVNTSAEAGDLLQLRFGYTVESQAPIILARLGMTGSAAFPDGVNTVVEELCLGDAFIVDFCFAGGVETLIVFDIGLDAALTANTSVASLNTLGVIKDIVVDGGLAGSASLEAATNQFTVVPEPQSVVSVSLALLAGFWVRARRTKLRRER